MTEARPAAAVPRASEGRGRRHPWRENLETLAVAIVLALALKVFAVEAYKIPTGSMQPTVMGSDEAGIYDRILVDKLSYLFRDPERWEIVVFRFPLDLAKNYIKRIVGVGPEWIRVEHGDLYRRPTDREAWEIARKPRQVQEAVWKRVYDGPDDETDPFRAWLKESGRWSFDGESIRAEGAGRLRYHAPVRDIYTDGYPESIQRLVGQRPRPARHDLADLRLSVDVVPEADFAGLRLSIVAGVDTYEAYLPGPAGTEGAHLRRATASNAAGGRDGGNGAATGAEPSTTPIEGVRLRADRRTRLSFAHVDGAMELWVDGDSVSRIELAEDPDRVFGAGNQIAVVTEGGRAALRRFRLERDIHYTKDGQVTTDFIPEGRYFMMGDNTQNSADSRAWESVSFSLREPVEGRTELRGNFRLDPNPAEANPRDIRRAGGLRFYLFTDVLGETFRVPNDAVQNQTRQPEPYVRREYILGRALVVFWPIPPFARVLRWKLVR